MRDFGRIPVQRADELAAQDAFAIDDVTLWPTNRPVQIGNPSLRVAHGHKIDPVFLQEAVIGVGVLVDAHREHSHPLVLHLFLHGDQGGSFFNTRRTPACPKIQNDDLAAELAECDLVVGIPQRKVGGCVPDARRTRAAIATGQESEPTHSHGSQAVSEEHTARSVRLSVFAQYISTCSARLGEARALLSWIIVVRLEPITSTSPAAGLWFWHALFLPV